VLPKFAPAAEAKLSEDDLVVGLQVGNAAKAYPIRYLNIHEVVNDTVGDAPAVIVWSALADTATALDRRIGDKVLQFGDAALIYQGAIVIYDVESLCLWTPISGKALTGPYAGGQALKPLQTVETTWKYWRSHYPNSMVLVGAAAKLPEMQKEMDSIDYTKNPQLPVPDYRTSDALVYPVEGFDIKGTPLPPKTIVFGIEVGTHARAYPQNVVAQKGEIRETLDGRELRVSYNAEGGFALAADAENNPILCQKMYWIVWKGLHPKSDIFGGVEKPAEKALPGAKPEGRREAPPPITPPLEKDSS
jgi:hypothetical protein